METRLLSDYIKRRAQVHDPRVTLWEDKVTARDVAMSIGCPLPDLYQVADHVDQIDFSRLPESFVLKWNNLQNADGILLLRDGVNALTGQPMSIRDIKLHMLKHRRQYDASSKFAKSIHFIRPRLLAEELLVPENPETFPVCDDYKCYVVRGKVLGILAVQNRFRGELQTQTFDADWRPILVDYLDQETNDWNIQRPQCLEAIVHWSERLGALWPDTFFRADFFATNRGAVFGEFTFNPAGGHELLKSADIEMGRLLHEGWESPPK